MPLVIIIIIIIKTICNAHKVNGYNIESEARAVTQGLNSILTRSSADADNGLDAFSGQSRSTNMVPFWVHCDFSLSM